MYWKCFRTLRADGGFVMVVIGQHSCIHANWAACKYPGVQSLSEH
jgi:hypothetical protein